jgi:hypothetical protein
VKGWRFEVHTIKKRTGKIEGMYPGWRSQFRTAEKRGEM